MDAHRSAEIYNRVKASAALIAALSIGLALAIYAYTGLFMRYSGDDYCYGSLLTKYGFFGGQVNAYTSPTPFHGNRYSLTWFSLFFSLFPPFVNGLLPALAIILWTLTINLLLTRLSEATAKNALKNELLIASFFLVFISLYTAPDLPESLYWRSAMLPYLAPVVGNLFLIVGIANYPGKKQNLFLWNVTLLALAFVSAGFSETVAAMQLGYLVIWFLIVSFGKQLFDWNVIGTRKPVGIAAIGSILAMTFQFISPSIHSQLGDSTFLNSPVESGLVSIRYTNDFVLDSFKSFPLPHIITFILFFVLSLLVSSRSRERLISVRTLLVVAISVTGLCYFLISLGMAPSVFVRGVYPNPRALIASRFLVMVAVASIGFVLGGYSSRYMIRLSMGPNHIKLIAAVVLIGISIYALRGAYRTYGDLPRYQLWASRWDARDTQIRADLATGARNLEVVRFEKVIQWVGELSADPMVWHNVCAAGYYGAESISASISLVDD